MRGGQVRRICSKAGEASARVGDVIEAHDAWRAWTLLLRSIASPADVLREALVDAPGLEGCLHLWIDGAG